MNFPLPRPLPQLSSFDLHFLDNDVLTVPRHNEIRGEQFFNPRPPSFSNYSQGTSNNSSDSNAGRYPSARTHTATVTDNLNELTFRATPTTVIIKCGGQEMIIPKQLWRTLEALRHSQLSRAEIALGQDRELSADPFRYMEAAEEIRDKQAFHPIYDLHGIAMPYSNNHYEIWSAEDVLPAPPPETNSTYSDNEYVPMMDNPLQPVSYSQLVEDDNEGFQPPPLPPPPPPVSATYSYEDKENFPPLPVQRSRGMVFPNHELINEFDFDEFFWGNDL